MSKPTKIILDKQSDLILTNAKIVGATGIVKSDLPGLVSDLANLDTAIQTEATDRSVAIQTEAAARAAEIATERLRINAILEGSDVNLNQFREVVAFVQSIDLANDTDLLAKVTEINGKITAEETARIAGDAALTADLATLQSYVDTTVNDAIAQLSSDLADLQSYVDTTVDSAITSLTADLADETAARIADVDTEEARAIAAEATLQAAIDAEAAARIAADSTLDGKIADIISNTNAPIIDSFTEVVDNLNAEIARAEAVEADLDATLRAIIVEEHAHHTAAEATLQAAIDAEAAARIAADETLDGKIADIISNTNAPIIDSFTEIVDSLNAEIARAEAAEASLEAAKLDLAGGNMTGNIDMGYNNIGNVNYISVDNIEAAGEKVTFGSAEFDFNNYGKVTNLPAPTNGGDAANKTYVDNAIVSANGDLSNETTLRIAGDAYLQSEIDLLPLTDGDTIEVDLVNSYVRLKEVVAAPDSGVRTFEGDIKVGAQPDTLTGSYNELSLITKGILDNRVSNEVSTLNTTITDEVNRAIASEGVLQSNIDNQKVRIDAILEAAGSETDNFVEIVALINSVDTTNDEVFAGYVLSNNQRLTIEEQERLRLTNLLGDGLVNEQIAREDGDAVLQHEFDVLPTTDGETIEVNPVDNTIRLKDVIDAPDTGYRVFRGDVKAQAQPETNETFNELSFVTKGWVDEKVSTDLTAALIAEEDARTQGDATLQANIESGDATLQANIESTIAEEVINRNIAITQGDSVIQAEIDLLPLTDGDTIEVDLVNNYVRLKEVVAAPDSGVRTFEGDIKVGAQPDTLTGSYNELSLITKGILDNKVSNEVSTINNSISEEVSRAQNAEGVLQSNIDNQKVRIDAILEAAGSETDNFVEIVALINSVDTTNDEAFASYVISNNQRLTVEEQERLRLTNLLGDSVLNEQIAREDGDAFLQHEFDVLPTTDGETIEVNPVDNTIRLKDVIDAPDTGYRVFRGDVKAQAEPETNETFNELSFVTKGWVDEKVGTNLTDAINAEEDSRTQADNEIMNIIGQYTKGQEANTAWNQYVNYHSASNNFHYPDGRQMTNDEFRSKFGPVNVINFEQFLTFKERTSSEFEVMSLTEDFRNTLGQYSKGQETNTAWNQYVNYHSASNNFHYPDGRQMTNDEFRSKFGPVNVINFEQFLTFKERTSSEFEVMSLTEDFRNTLGQYSKGQETNTAWNQYVNYHSASNNFHYPDGRQMTNDEFRSKFGPVNVINFEQFLTFKERTSSEFEVMSLTEDFRNTLGQYSKGQETNTAWNQYVNYHSASNNFHYPDGRQMTNDEFRSKFGPVNVINFEQFLTFKERTSSEFEVMSLTEDFRNTLGQYSKGQETNTAWNQYVNYHSASNNFHYPDGRQMTNDEFRSKFGPVNVINFEQFLTFKERTSSEFEVQNLQSNIDAQAVKITAILEGSDVSLDTFKEVVDFVQSIDMSNDDSLLNVVTNINSTIDAETAARIADVDAEEARAIAAEGVLQSAIAAEVAARDKAVLDERNVRIAGDEQLSSDLADLQSYVDTTVDSAIATLTSDLADETAARIADVNAEEARAIAAEGVLQTNINTESTERAAEDITLQGNIDIEATRAQSAETAIASDLGTETAARIAAVSAEEARATAAEFELTSDLSAEVSRATAAEGVLQSNIDYETSRIDAILIGASASADNFAEIVALINSVDTTNDTGFASYVLSNDAALAAEIDRATITEGVLHSALEAEIARAYESEGIISTNLSTEVLRATAAEATLTAALSTEQESRIAGDASLQASLNNEITDRIAAGQSAQAALDTESARAMAAEAALSATFSAAISFEEAARITAVAAEEARAISVETAMSATFSAAISFEEARAIAAELVLTNNLSSEEAARIAADAALSATLQSNIDEQAAKITAILEGSTVDLNQFAEVVAFVQSIDMTNDQSLLSVYATFSAAMSAEEAARIADVDAEEARAIAAEGVLTSALSSEESSRIAADAALSATFSSALSAETVARITAISSEESSRIAGDAALSATFSAAMTTETARATAAELVLTTDFANIYCKKVAVAGTPNGVLTTFTLALPVRIGSEMISINGLLMEEGEDYTTIVTSGKVSGVEFLYAPSTEMKVRAYGVCGL